MVQINFSVCLWKVEHKHITINRNSLCFEDYFINSRWTLGSQTPTEGLLGTFTFSIASSNCAQLCIQSRSVCSVNRNSTTWALWWTSSRLEGSSYRRDESFLTAMRLARSFLSTVTKIYCDTSSITQSTPVSVSLLWILAQPSALCHVEWAAARHNCAVILWRCALRSFHLYRKRNYISINMRSDSWRNSLQPESVTAGTDHRYALIKYSR